MIKDVTITNSSGESFTLELSSPEKSGLIVESITGLGPTKASINITSSATTDISRYNSARLNARNLVFKLKYLACDVTPMIEDARLLTYRIFPLKKKVRITVHTDNRYITCNGYVESNEPDIFKEKSGCSISILCPDPFFYDEKERDKNVTYNNVMKIFKFPFRTTETKKIIFGYISALPLQEIMNVGDAEVGLTISFIINSPTVLNPFVMDYNKNQNMKILSNKIVIQEEGQEQPVTGLLKGDVISIVTENSKKKVLLYRNNKEYNIISALESYTTWLVLEKGINVYTFGAETGLDDLEVNYEYTIVYEGA